MSGSATRVRIVATIGPASGDAVTVDALLDAGLAVARVNCAHGTPESLATLIALLRDRAAARGAPLAILADLGGPKLRVGRLAGGAAHLIGGEAFTLTTADVVGDATRVHVDYPALPRDVRGRGGVAGAGMDGGPGGLPAFCRRRQAARCQRCRAPRRPSTFNTPASMAAPASSMCQVSGSGTGAASNCTLSMKVRSMRKLPRLPLV